MKEFLLVTKLAPSSLAIELLGNLDAITIHSAIPGPRFRAQSLEIGDSLLAQTWPREDPDFDLRLIKPTSMGRRVMDGEAAPNFGAILASYTSVSDFRPWMLRLSMTRSAAEYARAKVTAPGANSKPDRSAVGDVK